jgi:membrane protein implicated in regulation of membrane protease activity
MGPLQILYIVLAAVGTVLLLISLFGMDAEMDVDLDVGNTDFDISNAESGETSVSLFSIRTLSTFILAFGVAGWTVLRGDGAVVWQILAGFGAGVVVSFLYYLVMKFLYSMQGNSMTTAASLIGKEGTITIPTTSTGVAQVRVNTVSGLSEFTCKEKSGKKLNKNETVKITGVSTGMQSITVEKV